MDAITITRAGGKVLVDWVKCIGCGKCISVCPNKVFSLKGDDYSKLIAIAKIRLKKRGVVFFPVKTVKVSVISHPLLLLINFFL